MDYEIVDTHISHIKCGDVVQHEGRIVTVGNKDLTSCVFLGPRIFGDTYSLGTQPVKLLKIITPTITDESFDPHAR